MGPLDVTAHHIRQEPVVPSNQPSIRGLVRSGALAGAIAAVCTTAVAAIASAADVSLEINAKAIPIPAFAWWTLVGAALGVVLARLLRERRRFVVVATIAVGLSLIPAIAAPDDTATKAVLVGTHLLAAAIIIPTLSRRLRCQQRPLTERRQHRPGPTAGTVRHVRVHRPRQEHRR